MYQTSSVTHNPSRAHFEGSGNGASGLRKQSRWIKDLQFNTGRTVSLSMIQFTPVYSFLVDCIHKFAGKRARVSHRTRARLLPPKHGSIPVLAVSCGLYLVLALYLVPKVFLRLLWFFSLSKNGHL